MRRTLLLATGLMVLLALPAGAQLLPPSGPAQGAVHVQPPSLLRIEPGQTTGFDAKVTGSLQCAADADPPTPAIVALSKTGFTYNDMTIWSIEPTSTEIVWAPDPETEGSYRIDTTLHYAVTSDGAPPQAVEDTVDWQFDQSDGSSRCTDAGYKVTTDGDQMAIVMDAADEAAENAAQDAPVLPPALIALGLGGVAMWRRRDS